MLLRNVNALDDTQTLLLVRRRPRLAPVFVDKRGLQRLLDRHTMTDAGVGASRVPKLSELVRIEQVRRNERARARTMVMIAAVVFFAAGLCAAAPGHHAPRHIIDRVSAWVGK
jgi:hypothetical protein